MKNYKGIIILANLFLLLFLFNQSVLKKEAILADGQLVLLKLAPVDPRSLMQGDYMRLRYEMTTRLEVDSIPKRGFCVVTLDEQGVAKRERLQTEQEPVHEGEYLIEYTIQDWRSINIGAESFFFQEGHAQKYEEAEYGGLKIDAKGNSILIGLYDENRQRIE